MRPGMSLLRIVNRRADRSRLDELRRLISQLEGEKAALVMRRDDLKTLHEELERQASAFRIGRIRQVEARVGELKGEISGAEATYNETQRVLERVKHLAHTGTMTEAALDKAKRDVTVAAGALAALRHRLEGTEIELNGLRQGIFIGDSYNDQPRSAQRADELAQRLSELAADIHAHETRLAGLRADLEQESKRYAERASADLVVPVRSSIWEVMTAPSETVVRGQDLARLLDCSGVVVTATVGETAYNRLRIGAPASFRFRGESADYKGRIVGLTGVATAPANLAIQPAALAREPYRVTVELPDLAKPGQCAIGRTGRVTFGR
jgi:multidrug resistance efflux pump